MYTDLPAPRAPLTAIVKTVALRQFGGRSRWHTGQAWTLHGPPHRPHVIPGGISRYWSSAVQGKEG